MLVDPITNEPKYIGKTYNLKKRLNIHIQKSKNKIGKLNKNQSWIRSLLFNNLKPKIESLDIVPETEWKFWEKYYITLFKSWGFNLKNGTNGGDGWEKGNIPWNKGKTLSEEIKKKLSNLKMGKLNNRYGIKQSLETIEKRKKTNSTKKEEISKKISIAKKGKKQSLEHIKKLSESRKGRTPWNKGISGYSTKGKGKIITKEVRDKIRNTLTKYIIIQLTKDDKVIRKWSRKEIIMAGYSIGNISEVCLGHRKTAYGFKWKYENIK